MGDLIEFTEGFDALLKKAEESQRKQEQEVAEHNEKVRQQLLERQAQFLEEMERAAAKSNEATQEAVENEIAGEIAAAAEEIRRKHAADLEPYRGADLKAAYLEMDRALFGGK